MNRSMKQMLSALLVVAMVAALLVVPSVAAADKTFDGTYRLTADTTTVKVGASANAVKADYKNEAGTYDVVADTAIAYKVADDTVATATVKDGNVVITGVKAGETTLEVAVKETEVKATYAIKVEAAVDGPTTGIFTLTADEALAALDPTADPSKNYSGTTEPFTTADKFFTVYPKFGGYNSDGTAKPYNKLEIRPITSWGSPTWSDGYAPVGAFRMDGGGNKVVDTPDHPEREFVSNVVKFTVGAPSVVKVWFIQKDAAGVALYEAGNAVATVKETITAAEKEAGIVTLTITTPGTYYLGGCDAKGEGAKINVAKAVVNIANTPEPAPEKVMKNGVYAMVADDLAAGLANGTLAAEGWPTEIKAGTTAKIADGAAPLEAGTEKAFTVYPKVGGQSDIRKSGTTNFEGFEPAWRLSLGGAVSLGESLDKPVNAIKFTTGDKATVKVWWAKGGDGDRQITILNTKGEAVATTTDVLESGKAAFSTLELAAKGTYYLGNVGGSNHIYKVEVTVGSAASSVDTTALKAAIEAADGVYTTAKDTKVYKIMADTTKPATVTKGQKYFLEKDVKALVKAIADAKAVLADKGATQETVDKAVAALNTAVDTFNKAVKTGTKSNSTNPGSSSGRPSRPDGSTPSTGLPFTDVKADDWFFASVQKAFAKGLMKGTSDTTFAPEAKTTRAMVATVLYRLAGENKTDVANLFNDVVADSWYTDAVAWAAEKGIVKGYDETTFAPNDNVTREQLVVMLYRYANATVNEGRDLTAFQDAASVSDWAVDAMTWAVDKGLILGRGNATLDPQGLASRAEICTVLVRYLEMK